MTSRIDRPSQADVKDPTFKHAVMGTAETEFSL